MMRTSQIRNPQSAFRSLVATVLTVGAVRPLAAQAPPAGATPPRVAGYIQPRFEGNGDSALFKVRRARLTAQGQLALWATYKVQVELRNGGTGAAAATVAATDLLVTLASGAWSATVGQLKTPFSRAFLTPSTELELPERPLVVDALAPNRDVGVAVAWTSAERVSVQAGAFNGEGVNRAANPDGRFLYVGRVVVTPAPGMDAGGSAAGGPDSATWGAEVDVHGRGWRLRAEYLARHRRATGDDAAGWYALGAYRWPRPPLQVVAQVEQYDPTDLPADRATGYTGGVQYFLRGDDLKLAGSYTAFAEQGASVANDRLVFQLQARF